MSERDLVGRLTRDVDRQHHLIWEQRIKRIDGERLSIYRFRHSLFQRYLYRDLSETEREFLGWLTPNVNTLLFDRTEFRRPTGGYPGRCIGEVGALQPGMFA